MSLRLLLDANMSPRTAQFLRDRFGFDAESLITRDEGGLRDQEVANIAVKEHRILLTFDLDFGEIFYRRIHPTLSVIILRLVDESSPAVNQVLDRFFDEHQAVNLEASLTIVTETRIRRRTTR